MHCETDLVAPDAADTAAHHGVPTREVHDRDGRPASEGTRITTAVVGILAGVALGLATFLATMVPLGGGALVAAPVAWLVGTVAIARQRTLSDAVGLAALLLASTVVVFPLGLSLPTLGDQLAAGQVARAAVTTADGLVAAVFFLPVWGGLGVVGWYLRR